MLNWCTHAFFSFPLGFGLGPLFTAPLSEAFGRYPLYFFSSLFYLVFFIPIAYGQNIQTVIICRFIQGIAASTGSTLVGGTVSDLFDSHNRGSGMAVFSICAFAGTGLGPAVSGYIELKKGWRWIEWVQVCLFQFSTFQRAGNLSFRFVDDVCRCQRYRHHSFHSRD